MLTKYFTEPEFILCCDILNGIKCEKSAIKAELIKNVKHWGWKSSEVDLDAWSKKVKNLSRTVNDELYTRVREFWDEADEDHFKSDDRLREMGLIWD